MVGCGNTFTPNHNQKNEASVKPLWKTYLNSDMIYHGGLIDTHIYDGCVIFHTTLADYDNRLCGVNIETGAIEWLFPSEPSDALYNSRGYIYDKYLVVQSLPNNERTSCRMECMDLSQRSLAWSTELPHESSITEICGYNDKCYHIQDNDDCVSVYCTKIVNGETTIIFQLDGDNQYACGQIMVTDGDAPKLLFFVCNMSDGSFDSTLYVYDLLQNKLLHSIAIDDCGENNVVGRCVAVSENKVYCSIGAMTTAINYELGETVWTYHKPGFFGARVVYNDGVVVKYGRDHYIGINAEDGTELYCKEIGSHWWSYIDGNYLYLCHYTDNIWIIDLHSGRKLDTLICPEKAISGNGFDCATLPIVDNGKLYIMSNTSAYCYPAYPWNKE